MLRDRFPPPDAEKCEKEELLENFKLPPGLFSEINRSLLLLGTRGSGKTYFLRKCRHTHKGVAFIGDLKCILNPITQDTGGAGLSFEIISPSIEPLIRSKTVCLLSAWIFGKCAKWGIEPPFKSLKKIIPPSVTINDNLFNQISELNLDNFEACGNIISFLFFVSELAQKCHDERGGTFLILLDRAEDIPYPSLNPIFSLLDQSHPFFVVVASRPGIIGPQSLLSPLSINPGDHYDIHHLGSSPYTLEWHNFAKEVLKAWIPNTINQYSSEMLRFVLHLSRDSLRNAVLLSYNSIDDETNLYSENKFEEKFYILQNTLLNAAQGSLRHLNPDLKGFVQRIKRNINPFILPIFIEFIEKSQGELPLLIPFRELSKGERFIRLALRSGFFTTINNVSWNPFASIKEFEIPPIYIAKKEDKWYNIHS